MIKSFLALLQAFVLILIMTTIPLLGQNAKKNNISLGLGRQLLYTRDMAASPMMYSGYQDLFQISYYYSGCTNRHILDVSAGRSLLGASTKNTMMLDYINLSYSYYHFVTSLIDEKLSIFAGLGLNHISSEKQFNIAEGFMNIGSFDEATNLNLSILSELKIASKDKITLGIHSPLMAYILRPDYSLFPRDNISKYEDAPIRYYFGEGKFTSISNFSGLNLWISYDKTLFQSIALRVNYNLMYYKIKKPTQTGLVANSLNLNFVYLF
ncbi:MAG: hypothetical protein Q8858_10310 [Bacteroidota bacterium]|nr:hypothetical protein [Bacteroidota bacterium]